MKLDVNKPQLTIMGVRFNNQKEFRGALYAIRSNMIEGDDSSIYQIVMY
ncbi:hypothetical protein [Salinicoccus sp. Marseille-QA3877]